MQAFLRLARKFFEAVLPGVIRPLHSLWNEMLGFLFFLLAILMVRPVWRGWKELEQGPEYLLRFLLSAFMLALMLGFSIHAFWKARRISRRG
jgi:type VI protein secretion system component VasK